MFRLRWKFPEVLACLILTATPCVQSDEPVPPPDVERAQVWIAQGSFSEAERLLRSLIPDPDAPVTSPAAIQLEILRRTRLEFPWTSAQILAQIQQDIPNATIQDLDRWRLAGDLQAREIEGELRYFVRARSNLYCFNAEARQRRNSPIQTEPAFVVRDLVPELVARSITSDSMEIYPIKHTVRYRLTVNPGHPRLRPGAVVRAWLPYPQEYRQQRNVQLLGSEPPHRHISENGGPHRSVYFEETIADISQTLSFMAKFQFVCSAYCPKLDAALAEPSDPSSEVVREYTAERLPHIRLTPQVRQLAAQIVREEANPLEQARRIFRWVSVNIPWCSEMEYSIIPSISEKGLTARRGDCGVQGLSFITLCRAAGIPARWQSGWQTKPGNWNMHDWSEIYIEPWGWLPVDASYGVLDDPDPRVRDFFCGSMDPYRLIVNLDYGCDLEPGKISFRSEPNDFQRGEIEIDGHNLYFDEWNWSFEVETQP